MTRSTAAPAAPDLLRGGTDGTGGTGRRMVRRLRTRDRDVRAGGAPC